MSKARLIEMAREGIKHAKAGTIEQTAEILKVPASHYYEKERWQQEVKQVFRRLPLMLALTGKKIIPSKAI